MISDWILIVLKEVARKKLAPTITARVLFLFTQLVYDGFQIATGNNKPLDMFSRSLHEFTITELDQWVDATCDYSCNIIIKSFGGSYIPTNINNVYNNSQYLKNWKIRADQYMLDRSKDGNIESNTISGTIPNQNQSINPTVSGLPSLDNYNSWTKLVINGSEKKYLTPEWGNVKGVVNDNEFKSLLDIAIRYYPGDEQWDKEIKDVLEITNNLTDKQRMSAEFWAGGPASVTPPGFWFLFSYCISKSNNLELLKEIQLYTLLGMGVFQGSICAWKLKRMYLQARPIQTIRHNESNDNWLPYQESNFVTPPFPDFVSGHSTFSSVSSRIIYQVLKENSIDLRGVLMNSQLLKLLNPILFSKMDNTTINLCQINVLPSSSEIKTNTPLSGCSIGWSTLDEMADDAGRSRIYGGIHYESSNQAGLSMGRELAMILGQKYAFLMDYGLNREAGGFRIYK
jgi:hypothetical protein